jgi:hypothetical protein
VLEIHRDAVADRRLHLAHAPVGLAGMAHARSRYEALAQSQLPRLLSESTLAQYSSRHRARPAARGESM